MSNQDRWKSEHERHIAGPGERDQAERWRGRGGEDRGFWSGEGGPRDAGGYGRAQHEQGQYGAGPRGEDWGSRGGMGEGGFGASGPSGQGYGPGPDRIGEGGRGGGYGQGSGMGGPYGQRGRWSGEGGYGQGRSDGAWSGGEGWGGYGRDDGGPGYGARSGDRGMLDKAADEVASWFGSDEAERRRRMDSRGEHRGRGPKGYARSDERIREEVCDRLTDDPMVDASEIEISVSSGEVTLSGTVDRRETRRRAEDLVESISGVTHVQNNLRLSSSGSTFGSVGSGSTTTGTSGSTGATGTTSGSGMTGGAASRRGTLSSE